MSAVEPEIPEDWYVRAFGSLYPVVYAHRTVEAAAPEVEFAAKAVRLTNADRSLDLCCGNGRHLAHLVRYAGRVVGMDYSPELLELARSLLGTKAPLVRADMRAMPFTKAFDVVFNFFTSFGYFSSADENAQVARGVAAALRPRGRFFMDHVNAAHARQHLIPESVRRQGAFEILERRWIDAATQRLNKHTRVLEDGDLIGETQESVQLYTPAQFRELLGREGLEVDQFFGDYSGAPLDESQPRMIVVGHKG